MSYKNTLQADALKLVAKKLQSSLAVEGELPEDGLAAYGGDLMMALAHKIVGGEEETVEEVFVQTRNAEATAEELLVDDGWKPMEVEPKSVEVSGNGRLASSHDAIGFGPTVELVLDNGHAPANGSGVNGNGHGAKTENSNRHHEAYESQQSLFSWTEFMAEEPVEPRNLGRKPQPSTVFLFEWALTLEREREAEPVGAGH